MSKRVKATETAFAPGDTVKKRGPFTETGTVECVTPNKWVLVAGKRSRDLPRICHANELERA